MIKDLIPESLRPALRAGLRLTNKLARGTGIPRLIWQTNLNTEIAFWEKYIGTKGGDQWREDFQRRLDPNAPLDADIAALLPAGDSKILDVGAGPLSVLGKTAEGKNIALTAVDPLAPAYDELLAKYDVNPPVRTVYCKAEELRELFDADQFDLVHAQNCIDHSFNPLRAFEQMVEVARPGGYIIARHEINEGENENYVGLHQWNFFAENGEFLISDRAGKTVNVSRQLNGRAEVECDTEALDGWLFIKMKKNT